VLVNSKNKRKAATEQVSELTTGRLSVYLRCLNQLEADGVETISSQTLAERFHLNSAQIRKDLAYFGEFGVRLPSKKGISISPALPAGTEATALDRSSCDNSNRARTISVATVTFIVQTSGNHWPVESQNAATSPFGQAANAGAANQPKVAKTMNAWSSFRYLRWV